MLLSCNDSKDVSVFRLSLLEVTRAFCSGHLDQGKILSPVAPVLLARVAACSL
jgi:hypothetical protein